MNNIRPKIGIPTPTSIDLAYNQRSWGTYAAAIRQAGGDPIELALDQPIDSLQAAIAGCDGLVLPGSPADVDPSLYDTPRLDACGPADPAREQMDYLLLRHALDTAKPLLGICYGCQSMNTFFGGTLIQDLSPLPVNHGAGASVAIAHTVLIPEDSLLASTLRSDREATSEAMHPLTSGGHPDFLRLPVNTSHHQSVATTGPNLQISAHCPDDEVIEAIEPTAMFHVEHPAFLLGVQWHPERNADISAASRAIFARLVAEAAANRKTV